VRLHQKRTLGPALSRRSVILRCMGDHRDPSYTPFGKRQAARDHVPGEALWMLRRESVDWSCELVFRGESLRVGMSRPQKWRIVALEAVHTTRASRAMGSRTAARDRTWMARF